MGQLHLCQCPQKTGPQIFALGSSGLIFCLIAIEEGNSTEASLCPLLEAAYLEWGRSLPKCESASPPIDIAFQSYPQEWPGDRVTLKLACSNFLRKKYHSLEPEDRARVNWAHTLPSGSELTSYLFTLLDRVIQQILTRR